MRGNVGKKSQRKIKEMSLIDRVWVDNVEPVGSQADPTARTNPQKNKIKSFKLVDWISRA